jgi:hypothetical protein
MAITPTQRKGRKSASTATADGTEVVVDCLSLMLDEKVNDLKPKGRLASRCNLISSIQDLLNTNEEILQRHLNSMKIKGAVSVVTHKTFEMVKSQYVNGVTRFFAQTQTKVQEFDVTPLVQISPEIGDLFTLERDDCGLINYKLLFAKSAVLHESILLPFLTHLKNHLTAVHTCLSAIDELFTKLETNARFLETSFGVDMTEVVVEKHGNKNTLCECCGWNFDKHEVYTSFPAGGTTFTSNGYGYVHVCGKCGKDYNAHVNYRTCPQTAYACPGSEKKKQFKANADLFLVKEFATPHSENNASFNISDKNQRMRLLKLIEFVSFE